MRFTLPPHRSLGFGSHLTDSPRLNTVALAVRLRPYRFPCAFPDNPVRLASGMHSLVRFSKRTTEHRLPSSPTGDSRLCRSSRDLVCPVAPSPTDFRPYCTALLGVLFSVRSRYLFAIGLEECLVFPVDAWGVHEGYPTPATQGTDPQTLSTVRDCRPVSCSVPGDFSSTLSACCQPVHHIAREGFGLDCVAVTRGY